MLLLIPLLVESNKSAVEPKFSIIERRDSRRVVSRMSAETRSVSWKSRRLSSKIETPRPRLEMDVPLGRWAGVVVEEVCVEEEIELLNLEGFV